MIGYSIEEIREKVQKLAVETEETGKRIEEAKAQMLVNRGRIEELSNLHNLMVAEQQKEDKPDNEEASDEG